MKIDTKTYKVTAGGSFGRIAFGIGLAGVILCLLGYFTDREHFFFAYLTGFAFWVSIALGALFFTMLQHLTSATWSIVVRRIAEQIAAQLPWLFLLFIPLLLGMHELYHWSHAETVQSDAALQWKAPYLNISFFTIRSVLYFVIWSALALYLRRASLRLDDSGHPDWTARMKKVSAGGMVVFALSVSLAGFDWLMSLEPHWYSTIFGVYFFAGGFLASLALIVLLVIHVRRGNMLRSVITREHFHDLGKLMFGFTIFWAYIGYSQYFLQWYGNVPEETVWYLSRWDGADGTAHWKWISMILIFGQFFLPFFILIFQRVKRNLVMMSVMAIWLLVMHWVDMYWLVLPVLYTQGPHITWIDLGTPLAIGGIILWLFWRSLVANPVVPVGDPKLRQSIEFVNH